MLTRQPSARSATTSAPISSGRSSTTMMCGESDVYKQSPTLLLTVVSSPLRREYRRICRFCPRAKVCPPPSKMTDLPSSYRCAHLSHVLTSMKQTNNMADLFLLVQVIEAGSFSVAADQLKTTR